MIFSGMRVLVTGASGFLGGRVTRRLMSLGAEVTATGRNRQALSRLGLPKHRTIATDLSDRASVLSFEGPFDAVVHCAGSTSPWGRLDDLRAANVETTRAALSIAQRSHGCRFIHISSPTIYFRTQDQFGIREDAPLPSRPVNHYARTKREAECLVQRSHAPSIILRLRSLYGPGDTKLLPGLVAAAEARPFPLMRGGQARTDLTHVEDAVSAVMAALQSRSEISGRCYNIAGSETLSVKGAIEAICFHAGVNLRWRVTPVSLAMMMGRAFETASAAKGWLRAPLATRYGLGLLAWSQTLDIHRARHELDWAPQISFEDGLRETLETAFP